jgi:hypothetical protein
MITTVWGEIMPLNAALICRLPAPSLPSGQSAKATPLLRSRLGW